MLIARTTFLLVIVSFLVTGCWDIKDPQDVSYFTAIGFDYVDDQYIVYVQMVDFSTIAKSDTGKPVQQTPVWTGSGQGPTPVSAFYDLYNTSQLRVFFGHVNAIVYSENVLTKGIDPILDSQNRYYEMRYTPWIFGTNQSIEQLLSVTPFFYLSPIASLLHQPEDNYKQHSLIKPITVREFIISYREPGKTVILPSLNSTPKDWKEGDKPSSMLSIDGIFMLHNQEYKGRLDENDVLGLRWMEPDMNRGGLVLRSGEEPVAVVSLENPKVKIKPVMKDDVLNFTIDVKLGGTISEIIQPLNEEEMEEMSSTLVSEQIRSTFEKGLAKGADLLQLEYALYRQDNKLWKQLRETEQLQLSSDQLDIQVDVKLKTSGKLKINQ